MTWTTTPPTKPGWYWWRANTTAEPFILHLGMTARDFEGPQVLCTDYCEDCETPEDLGGEFFGPLEPPA